MPSQESRRIKPWGLVTICSLVSLISMCTASMADGNRDSTEKFAISVASISFIIALTFMINAKWTDITHTPNLLNGTIVELVAAVLNFVLWVFGQGFINSRNTAYYGGGGIKNANIYYFTWGAMLSSLLTVFHVAKQLYNPTREPHPRLGSWALLTTSSLIVFVGCIRAHIDAKCKLIGNQSSFCQRTVFGISLGCVTFVFAGATLAAVIVYAKDPKSIMQIESILSLLITISWAFGVAYLTGSGSPGTQIGNLYYFTWISFFSALVAFLDCLANIEPRMHHAITGQTKSKEQGKDEAVVKQVDEEAVEPKESKEAKKEQVDEEAVEPKESKETKKEQVDEEAVEPKESKEAKKEKIDDVDA